MFCTQKCLRGLVEGGELDFGCPNVELHRRGYGNNRHEFGRERFMELLREQLGVTMDSDCVAMGSQGARGALFKLTLTSHGYVKGRLMCMRRMFNMRERFIGSFGLY